MTEWPAKAEGGATVGCWDTTNKLGGRRALTIFMYVEWLHATRGLAGVVFLIAGKVVASAEAG